jgi:hypothetical protein
MTKVVPRPSRVLYERAGPLEAFPWPRDSWILCSNPKESLDQFPTRFCMWRMHGQSPTPRIAQNQVIFPLSLRSQELDCGKDGWTIA